MSEFRYKVLWVDDLSGTQDKIFASGFESVADEYGIDITMFTNWEEAEADLRKDFISFLMRIASMVKMTIRQMSYLSHLLYHR